MLYTNIPHEQIFDCDKSAELMQTQAIYMGEEVSLIRASNGAYSISRLISTNPHSYLKKEFMPGTAADPKKIKLL